MTNSTQTQYVAFKVKELSQKLDTKQIAHPLEIAQQLETLADLAWDDVDDLYQSAIRIDP